MYFDIRDVYRRISKRLLNQKKLHQYNIVEMRGKEQYKLKDSGKNLLWYFLVDDVTVVRPHCINLHMTNVIVLFQKEKDQFKSSQKPNGFATLNRNWRKE